MMNSIEHQSIAAQFETSCRRHPTAMLIVTLVLAVVAFAALVGQNEVSVILYQAF